MEASERKVLHRFQGENYIEVVEEGEHRSLYFQNAVVQSRIDRKTPSRLLLRYTRYMMAASLLVLPRPKNVLLIGVGAGALLHFFHHYFPDVYVDGIDYSEEIIEIARRFFVIPENERIRVYHHDGLDYLQRHNEKVYDLILVDAFDDMGMAKTIYSADFFKAARQGLGENGIICCNLWSGQDTLYARARKAVEQHSMSRVYIPVRRRENVIALLFQTKLPWRLLCPAQPLIETLNDRYALDFHEVSTTAKKHNMKIGEQLQLWLS